MTVATSPKAQRSSSTISSALLARFPVLRLGHGTRWCRYRQFVPLCTRPQATPGWKRCQAVEPSSQAVVAFSGSRSAAQRLLQVQDVPSVWGGRISSVSAGTRWANSASLRPGAGPPASESGARPYLQGWHAESSGPAACPGRARRTGVTRSLITHSILRALPGRLFGPLYRRRVGSLNGRC